MRRPRLIALLVSLFLLVSGAAAHAVELGPGAWSYFGDPRAIYLNGATYIGAVTPKGAIVVTRISAAGARTTVELVHDLGVPDDHNNPSLVVRPGGEITAFWSPHSGRIFPVPKDGPSHMYYRTTLKPGGIVFGPVHELPLNTPGRLGFTYPNPIEAGRLWMFWRGGSWQPSFTSWEHGRWDRPRILIQGPKGERPYAKYVGDARNRIAVAFDECHIAKCPGNSLHYAVHDGTAWRAADGRLIARDSALPFTPGQADMVYDAHKHGGRAWVQDIAFGADGEPIIVYIVRAHSVMTYWYARYADGRWQRHKVTVSGPATASIHPGGITLDHETPDVVYYSRYKGGKRDVAIATTDDHGLSWRSMNVTHDTRFANIRPVSPRGDPSVSVAWVTGPRTGFRHFQTSVEYQHLAITPAFLASLTLLRMIA